MCLFLIIFFLFSSSNRLFTFCNGFATELRKDSVAIIASRMVLHLLMSFCLFLKLRAIYERLVHKSALIFPAMHRYYQSTMFTEYSIYWRAVDHPLVLTEVSWLKPSSALMKKSRWKLVVNRWHKMTSNQVIFLTNWQLIWGRTKYLRGRRNLPDVIYFLLLHLF